jgi:hypothetical protein
MQKVLLKFKNPGENFSKKFRNFSFRFGNVKKFVFRNFKKKKKFLRKSLY